MHKSRSPGRLNFTRWRMTSAYFVQIFPAPTKVCVTPRVLSRKCPKSEVHRAFRIVGPEFGTRSIPIFLTPRTWRLRVYFGGIRRRLVVVTWLANLISSNEKPRLFRRHGDSTFATRSLARNNFTFTAQKAATNKGLRSRRTVLSLNGLCHCNRMKALRFWFVSIGGGSALI